MPELRKRSSPLLSSFMIPSAAYFAPVRSRAASRTRPSRVSRSNSETMVRPTSSSCSSRSSVSLFSFNAPTAPRGPTRLRDSVVACTANSYGSGYLERPRPARVRPWQDGRVGERERVTDAAAGSEPPPGGPGHAARALLRPRLRPGDHPVHGADVAPPDLGGARPGDAGARAALVVVGRLRLADQRRRPRGGRASGS